MTPFGGGVIARAVVLESEAKTGADGKILWVEDNPDVAEAGASMVRQLGYQVEVVSQPRRSGAGDERRPARHAHRYALGVPAARRQGPIGDELPDP